ncbi:hypothetical protein CVT24_010480 [Panaeolus cyanescens]|uniref:Uncharacterized protein n=1 Tax=Panaeolus cyanescens TaxID=181874 RepID=A0A409YVV6_9AGAR|nr:hypothetical protein CVT24_010480 [Panaeolus cyanescens]
MSPINVGFIGLSTTGWAATCLAPALIHPKLQGKFNLVALSTSNAASSESTTEKYSTLTGTQITTYHGTSGTTSIANDPRVDLVAVSVKAPMHRELVMPAIDAGKNVFVEWPVGVSLDETKEIAEAARRTGAKVMVNLNARNNGVVKKLKELIDSGAIGKVRSSTFVGTMYRESGLWVPWTFPVYKFALDKQQGATFLNVAVGHYLDAQSTVLGNYTSVTATSSKQFPFANVLASNDAFTTHQFDATSETVPNTSPDHYTFSGPLTNGAHSTVVWLSGASYGPGKKLLQWDIYGETGVISLQSSHPFMQIANPDLFLNGEKVTVEGVAATVTETVTPFGDVVDIQVNSWQAYADGAGYATIDDAIRVKKTLEAIEKSAEEGRTVVLSE